MIFDIETDGLNPTKIHVVSYKKNGKIHHTFSYEEMRKLFTEAKLLIGHNIILYDIPALERLLNIKIKARVIDTLVLSWYLNHKRVRHGLEWYGVDFGVPKPKVDDWENLSPEEYAHRCDEDVKINDMVWKQLKGKLLKLYGTKEKADKLIDYLTFKMDCLREQERSKWKLNKPHVIKHLKELREQEAEKLEELSHVLPLVPVYAERKKPEKPYKKDGTLSVAGAKWFALLKREGLPKTYSQPIREVVNHKQPNPGSHAQIKSWLQSLGWEPTSFKYVKDDRGERRIPQVRIEGDSGKELCPSVLKLANKEPAILTLEGLTVVQHRAGILSGFLRDEVDGYVVARAQGLTNTLRFKHTELVNLPGVNKPLGDVIRGSLIARDGTILCGSDMVSLESTTKKHYMFPYDPEYVKEMSKPDFDEHLDLAMHSNAVTQDAVSKYLDNAEGYEWVKAVRKGYKAANYASVYGVGAATLARDNGLTKKEAQTLIDNYWKRNWSVRKVSGDVTVKKVDGEMWLLNPVSNFWYSLRAEKDIFSTLNQGTGVYCFDTWVKHFRKVRSQLTGQFHDEVILEIKKGAQEKCERLLRHAIDKTNKELSLNVKLDIDVQFGNNYAEIH